jgi:putative ABC transport system permease protein
VFLPTGGLDNLRQRHALRAFHHRDDFGFLVAALGCGLALAFLFFVSVTASTMFGMLPALVLSKGDTMSSLQRGGRAGIGGGTRWLRALIVSEVAIAAVLLIGAGLLTKTLWDLSHSPLGFEPAGVLTMRTSLPLTSDSRYRSFIARSKFFSQALKRVASLPGVVSAGYTAFLPLTNGGGTSGFVIEGAAPPPLGQINDANHRVISPDYLRTLNVRIRAGRFFRESDTPDAPPVAIVNEAMARQYLPGRNPLGRRFRVDGNAPWITIVGVVDDIRQMSLDLKSRPEVYFPYTQPVGSYGYFTPRDLAVRVVGDPISYAATVQREIWAVDRNQPVADVMPMEHLIAEKLGSRYAAVRLIGAFAGLGLLLAALGLYGLLAYSVVQRRSEIGVRMALGAQPRQVLRAVVAEGFRLVLCGLVFGAAGSWFVMRGLRSLLYGVAPTDIRIFIGSALVLLFVGTIASYLPAHRAAVIEPLEALGHE